MYSARNHQQQKLRGYTRGRQYVTDNQAAAKQDDIEEYQERQASSFAQVFGNDDEFVEPLAGNDIVNVYRKTTTITNRSELLDKLKQKFEAGTLAREDALIYVTKLENISMENNALIEQEERANTITARFSRNKKKTQKEISKYGSDGSRPDIRQALDKNLTPAELKTLAELGGFYLFLTLDSQPMRPHFLGRLARQPNGSTERSSHDFSNVVKAYHDLYKKIEREALRQALRPLKDNIEIAHIGRNKCNSIADAFDRAELFYFPPVEHPVNRADVFDETFVDGLIRDAQSIT